MISPDKIQFLTSLGFIPLSCIRARACVVQRIALFLHSVRKNSIVISFILNRLICNKCSIYAGENQAFLLFAKIEQGELLTR